MSGSEVETKRAVWKRTTACAVSYIENFEVCGLGIGDWGLGFVVWGVWFGVWGLGCGVWVVGCGV